MWGNKSQQRAFLVAPLEGPHHLSTQLAGWHGRQSHGLDVGNVDSNVVTADGSLLVLVILSDLSDLQFFSSGNLQDWIIRS